MVLPATAGIVDMARQPRPRKTRARPRRAPRGPRAPERPRQRATARTSTAHLHPLGTAPRPRTFSPELHHLIWSGGIPQPPGANQRLLKWFSAPPLGH